MKKRNEDDPDNLGGLGGMLPAEVLKMLNELLEQQHRTGHPNNGSKIEVVYVASGGQHVETQINIGAHPNEGSEEPTSVTPPPEAMARAVERTMAQGYWWASTNISHRNCRTFAKH